MRGRRKDLPGSREGMEKYLFEALERLKAGKPRHPDLLKKAKLKKLKVNAPSLALEADCSITLFNHEGCNYPKVRQALLEIRQPVAKSTDLLSINRRLREEKKELEDRVALLQTENAALVMARLRAKKEYEEKLQEEINRLANKGRGAYELASPPPREAAKVLRFPVKQDE